MAKSKNNDELLVANNIQKATKLYCDLLDEYQTNLEANMSNEFDREKMFENLTECCANWMDMCYLAVKPFLQWSAAFQLASINYQKAQLKKMFA